MQACFHKPGQKLTAKEVTDARGEATTDVFAKLMLLSALVRQSFLLQWALVNAEIPNWAKH